MGVAAIEYSHGAGDVNRVATQPDIGMLSLKYQLNIMCPHVTYMLFETILHVSEVMRTILQSKLISPFSTIW